MATARTAAWWQGRILAAAGVLALLFVLHEHEARAAIQDADDPWHLTVGRIICETGQVPRQDPLCYTSDGVDWINLNWLAQVIVYRTYLAWGFGGAIALAAAVHTLTLLLTALHLRARRVRPLPALAALALVGAALLLVRGLRPQMFTFALLALCAWILGRPDPERRLGLGGAAALTVALALWNQLHGGFVFGYGLVGLAALSTSIASGLTGMGWLPRRALLLCGALALGLASFALHPHGFDALVYAVTYKSALGPQLFTIDELMPLDLDSPLGLGVLGFVVAASLALVRGARPHAADAFVCLVFLVETLRVKRVAVPLALFGAPVVAAWWSEVMDAARPRLAVLLAALDVRLEPLVRVVPWTLGLAAVGWLTLVAPRLTPPGVPGQLSRDLDPVALPVEAALYLKRSGAQGRVFNEYHLGGLLGWVLYPERRLAIDGRGDLHARSGAFADCLEVTGVGPRWRELLTAWEVDLVVSRTRTPLVDALRAQGYVTLHEDATFVVLRRPPP